MVLRSGQQVQPWRPLAVKIKPKIPWRNNIGKISGDKSIADRRQKTYKKKTNQLGLGVNCERYLRRNALIKI
jgi:hypothetical protein